MCAHYLRFYGGIVLLNKAVCLSRLPVYEIGKRHFEYGIV